MNSHEQILILDFGSQYTQLIARRIREQHVFCRILRHDIPAAELAAMRPAGIVLSGGPASVFDKGAPRCDAGVFELGRPVLGICYGMQLMAAMLGGEVVAGSRREYGHARVRFSEGSALFKGLPLEGDVWMSHGDSVARLPTGFAAAGSTETCATAAMEDAARKLFGIQFHAEVAHTAHGTEILRNFLFSVCGCRGDWRMRDFAEESVERIREQVGSGRVICGLSGGVDSAVTAVLTQKAVGERLHCIFVDNGLLRHGEAEEVERTFRRIFGPALHTAHAAELFLRQLRGVAEPEEKRKVIGRVFIEVFTEQAARLGNVEFLAQGTLYPDVIESAGSAHGPAAVIKSHHNVGGLPEKLGFKLVEPLRELFKDEVRALGAELGLPPRILNRRPFPGPGLAVRIIGEVTAERLELLRQADLRVAEELSKYAQAGELWQAFAVLLPVRSVGVMGDSRTYENVAVIRAVTSADGMTADWARLPHELLARISSRITNEVRGINRVVYDISSKPPATIEWE